MSKECKESREWLEYHYADEYAIGSRFYSEKNEPRRARDSFCAERDKFHISHIRDCEECKAWVFSRVSPKIMERQQQLNQCCCPRMFGLLEGRRRANLNVKIKFKKQYHAQAEGELWYMHIIQNGNSIGAHQVNYCFYCGELIKTYEYT